MNFRTTLVVFSILGIFGLMFISVTENMVIVAHAAVSICTTIPGSACISTGKNPQECRATLPSCHTVTNRQAAFDRRNEIITCELAESCKVIVKH
ncbi:MAG TPA: hypothetical protein VFI73_03180 [Candidatus Nitrosopolaris sp.]|nr:hypothetical protein [Candidatus Nitrosopolaris sp.]